MQQKLVERLPSVTGIHHVHVWGLTPQNLMLTMHVTLDDADTDPARTIREVKGLLKDEYGISHSTIEIEYAHCADS